MYWPSCSPVIAKYAGRPYAASAMATDIKPTRQTGLRSLLERRTIVGGNCVVTLLPMTAYDVRYVPRTAVVGFAFETQAGSHAFASDRMRPFRTRPTASPTRHPAAKSHRARQWAANTSLSTSGVQMTGSACLSVSSMIASARKPSTPRRTCAC